MPRYNGEGKRETHGRIQGSAGVKLRTRRMERTSWLCEGCSKPGNPVIAEFVDHIVPLALGGKDVDENTRNLCGPCHDKATAEQFGQRQARRKKTYGADGWPI